MIYKRTNQGRSPGEGAFGPLEKKKFSYKKLRPQRIFSRFVLGMNPLYKMKGYAHVYQLWGTIWLAAAGEQTDEVLNREKRKRKPMGPQA